MPILYYRPGYGWLHPLIFPTVYGLVKSLALRPDQLLDPFLFPRPSSDEIVHVALIGWDQESLAWAALKGQLIAMTALTTYYLGFFFGPQLRMPHLGFLEPRNLAPKALSVVACSVMLFLVFMQFRGGLTAHMASWGQGRFEALEGYGIIIALIRCGTVASLAWFALDRTASRNPLFWITVLYSVPVNFFTGGSRSAVITAVSMFLLIWIIRNRKIPHGRIVTLGIASLVLIGMLGQLRRSTFQGEADFTVVTEFKPEAAVDASQREIEEGRPDGYLPIIARVPDEVDFLYGKSYVGTLLFFVPRALWPDKPRGAGAMNGKINFGSRGGVPTGPVGEAYWNFYIPGVVVGYFLYGLFHQWLARAFVQSALAPAFWVLYIITLFHFAPESTSMVAWFQQGILAMAILYWMGTLSFSKRRV
jgi:hypothetical protein